MEALQTDTHTTHTNWQHLSNNAAMHKSTLNREQSVRKTTESRADTGQYFDLPDTQENREKIQAVIQELQQSSVSQDNVRMRIRMHGDSGHLQVTLENYQTGEIVEEIPSSKLLEFRKNLNGADTLFLEEKA